MQDTEQIKKEFRKKWVTGEITYHPRKKTTLEDDADDISNFFIAKIQARDKEIKEYITNELGYIKEQLKTEGDKNMREYLIGKRNAFNDIKNLIQSK